jgi:hypothetical protein
MLSPRHIGLLTGIPKNQMISRGKKNKTPTNECYNTTYGTDHTITRCLDLEAVSSHASLVLLNCRLALLLGVVGLGE